MNKTESRVEKLSSLSDDEIISETVKRLTNLYPEKGGRSLHVVSFLIDPEWAGTYRIELCIQRPFYRGQPPLEVIDSRMGLL